MSFRPPARPTHGPRNSPTMITLAQLFEFIRSVCFGAVAVSSLLMLAHAYFPGYFPADITRAEVFYAGAALGTLLHRALHAALFNPISRALGNSSGFYAKLAEANLLRKSGVLSEVEFKSIVSQLKSVYFGVPPERMSEAERRDAAAERAKAEELLRASEDAKRTLRELSSARLDLIKMAEGVGRRLERELKSDSTARVSAANPDAETARADPDSFDELDDTDDGGNNKRQ